MEQFNDQRQYERMHNFALAHGGCLTRAAAYEQGISKHSFEAAIRRRHLVKYRGVYALAGTEDSHTPRVWSALFRAGPGAVVTGPSALALRRFDGLDECIPSFADLPITVAVPLNRHLRIPHVVAVRDARSGGDVRFIGGIPVVDRRRAVVDSLRLLREDRARDVLYRALFLEWITAESLQFVCEELAGARGITQLRAMAMDAASGSRAESETLLHRILRSIGITKFAANFAAHDEAGLIGYIDIAVVRGGKRIALEVDGRAWHTDHRRFRHDRTRQNRLVDAGWTVLRFTWEDLTAHRTTTADFLQRAIFG